MTVHLKEVFPKRHHSVLNSVMPGGQRWDAEADDCLVTCPFFSSCDRHGGHGPSGRLCSDHWGSTGTKPIVWMVLKHVFDNFDHYNCGDLDKATVVPVVAEITDLLDFPFDETLSPAEARAIVKIRLRQAEFKANLFGLWGDCSLCNMSVDDRFLVASHIHPWSKSSDAEKLSKYNGFLLPPNYDYLFDRHLVSFSDDGLILLHDAKSIQLLYEILGIYGEAKLKEVYSDNVPYLEEHRAVFFEVQKKMSNKANSADAKKRHG